MGQAATAPHAISACPHNHVVAFYESDAFLVDRVSSFLAPGLLTGDAAVVVATEAHRHDFHTALLAAGIDVDAAVRDGRYVALDAADVLSRFMVDGSPNEGRFRDAVSAVMDRPSVDERPVRIYGEMVALLWEDGDASSALALEELWNAFAQEREFSLLCAYPMGSFEDATSAPAFAHICAQHTTVIPSEGYSLLADPAERLRAVARLQQRVAVLQAEVLRLRRQRRPDQAGTARDAAGAERGVAGTQRDEAGDERDHAGRHRDEAGHVRDAAGTQRDEAGDERDAAGLQRDEAGDERDQVAEERDQAADRRDQAAEQSEASLPLRATADVTGSALARREAASDRREASQDRRAGVRERTRAGRDRDIALIDRRAGASERMHAESDRDTALADRGAGASERAEAGLDRNTAQSDRGESARDREFSSRDALTGAYLRGPGFMKLGRATATAHRSERPLVLAFIDVDGLKGVNDSRGHAAGDQMLVKVANAFMSSLRADDLIIRYGGDEFVCAISGLDIPTATTRLALVQSAIARAPDPGSITLGLAELMPGDSPESLVARADARLYRQRGQRN